MNQPNLTPIDERLRAVLTNALQRDPNALRNADHLQALLSDLAPDMPGDVRSACVAVARTNAIGWLSHTPPYSEEQVVGWLRAQAPDVRPDAAAKAVAVFALLTGARSAPAPTPPPAPSPVFEQPAAAPSPVFEQPTVIGAVGQAAAPPTSNPPMAPPYQPAGQQYQPAAAQHQPAPQQYQPAPQQYQPAAQQFEATPPPPYQPAAQQWQQPSWPPAAPPPAKSSKKTGLIIALVLVLLAGAGVGAWFALKKDDSNSSSKLAAPKHVSAELQGSDSVVVSWDAVPNADHYYVTDLTGSIDRLRVTGTSHVFEGAGLQDHRFVVQAYTADETAGEKSGPTEWQKVAAPLNAPASLSVSRAGFDLRISWPAVDGADGYRLRDLNNSSFKPDTIHGTSVRVHDVSLTAHRYQVVAVRGSETSEAVTEAYQPSNHLSRGEAILAYKLPDSLAKPGTCSSFTHSARLRGLVSAAVSCDPAHPGAHGPADLFALQLKPGTQNEYERRLYGHPKVQSGCGNGYPSSGTQGSWTFHGKRMGDEYCFLTSSGVSLFAWTYYRQNILFSSEGDAPTTRTGLHKWWEKTPAELR